MTHYLDIVYYFVVLFFRRFVSFWKRLFVKPTPFVPPIVPPIDPLVVYNQQSIARFQAFVENRLIRNENIPPYFYSKKTFHTMIQDTDNTVEPIWKQRVLMKTTPRGNIFMYYDPYRMGFCYYADTATIPYSLLNSVAMNYSIIYRCVDFFMDNEFLFDSPLIAVFQDDKQEKDTPENKPEKTEKEKYMKELLTDGPFIKRKKNLPENIPAPFKENKREKETKEEAKKGTKEEKTVEFHRNKFVYLGKIYNYSFLKKEVAPSSVSNETGGQFKGLFNYSDYKKMKTL